MFIRCFSLIGAMMISTFAMAGEIHMRSGDILDIAGNRISCAVEAPVPESEICYVPSQQAGIIMNCGFIYHSQSRNVLMREAQAMVDRGTCRKVVPIDSNVLLQRCNGKERL